MDRVLLLSGARRCLERFISKHTLPLKQEVDTSDPTPEEKVCQ